MNTDLRKSEIETSANQYAGSIIAGWENLLDRKRLELYQRLVPHVQRRAALEMGCADGRMTRLLCRDFTKVDVLDASRHFLDQVARDPLCAKATLHETFFEDWQSERRFDAIFLTHILEHLPDPVAVLRRASQWLAPDGRLLVAVPNANSLNRLVGVKMGMLEAKDSLNAQDVVLGHLRVYTPELLRQHVETAGLQVAYKGGVMLKPLSNRQIEKDWSQDLISGFFSLGDDFPDLCSEIFVVAKLP
jgi:2-polyprenyl-3-methyl-5-hydroxy-6-metoxy-1,4-benzoquinol methylase